MSNSYLFTTKQTYSLISWTPVCWSFLSFNANFWSPIYMLRTSNKVCICADMHLFSEIMHWKLKPSIKICIRICKYTQHLYNIQEQSNFSSWQHIQRGAVILKKIMIIIMIPYLEKRKIKWKVYTENGHCEQSINQVLHDVKDI